MKRRKMKKIWKILMNQLALDQVLTTVRTKN